MEERERVKEKYSGADFIQDIETAWGGKLFFCINPEYEDELQDISPSLTHALEVVYGLEKKSDPSLPELTHSGNTAVDIRNLLIECMPHPEEAQNRVHLLACPFCRCVLDERLINFLSDCSAIKHKEESFPSDDQLPFILEGSDSILFSPEPEFFSLADCFYQANQRVSELEDKLELTDEEKNKFQEQFALSMALFESYMHLLGQEQAENLHPVVHMVALKNQALYYFGLAEHPLLPRLASLNQPQESIFTELAAEFDSAPNPISFCNSIFSHIGREQNEHFANFIAEKLTKVPEHLQPIAHYLVSLYYEIYSRSARRDGHTMLEITQRVIEWYERTLKNTKEDIDERAPNLLAEQILLVDRESKDSESLRKFWDQVRIFIFTLAGTGIDGALESGKATEAVFDILHILHRQDEVNKRQN